MLIIPFKLDFKGWSVICLIYLIKMKKKKAITGKEIIKIIFIVRVVIIIIFNIVDLVIGIKGLNMIDVVYVIQIKIAYTGSISH
jgi:hypothetical protein